MAKRPRIIGTTVEAIASAEARIGALLPPSLRAWLIEHNGAGPLFPIPDEREPRTLTGHMFHEKERLLEWGERFDARLWPIEAVGDGDVWCIDLSKRDAAGEARVVRWCHETGDVEDAAANVAEFLLMERE